MARYGDRRSPQLLGNNTRPPLRPIRPILLHIQRKEIIVQPAQAHLDEIQLALHIVQRIMPVVQPHHHPGSPGPLNMLPHHPIKNIIPLCHLTDRKPHPGIIQQLPIHLRLPARHIHTQRPCMGDEFVALSFTNQLHLLLSLFSLSSPSYGRVYPRLRGFQTRLPYFSLLSYGRVLHPPSSIRKGKAFMHFKCFAPLSTLDFRLSTLAFRP